LIVNSKICGTIDFDDDIQNDHTDEKQVLILPVCNGAIIYGELGISPKYLMEESLTNPGVAINPHQQNSTLNEAGENSGKDENYAEDGHRGQALTNKSTSDHFKGYTDIILGLVLVPEEGRAVYKRLGLFELFGDKSQLSEIIHTWSATTIVLV
jgi:hypothetical protein